MKYLQALIVVLLLPGAMALHAAGPPARPPAAVIVEPVVEVNSSPPREYIGNVAAIDEVDIPSRISGFITSINFKEGSLVKKGQLLFTIEDTTYRAQMMVAKAKLKQTDAEVRYAESNYERQRKLVDKNAVSQSNYEDAERLIEYNKAKYEQSKAELLDAENNLSYTKIYAPMDGRIGENKHSVGNYVSPNSTPLATIVSVNPIHVKFAISERDFLNLFGNVNAPHNDLIISINLANGTCYKYPGKVDFTDNMADSDTGTVAIWAEFPNPNLTLIPGGYVTVMLSKKLKKKLLGVKLSAVLTDRNGNYVYVVDTSNKVCRKNIETGDVVGSLYIVKSGLAKDELVITGGTSKVRNGELVKPVRAGAQNQESKK